ncbi:MAG TPA: PP2C family protein-serine/threonine phosphatase [Ignavibacteria bacterium]|nr:PP2C family protein-serine/threonine phosphatase [Ignavibacteria bacterium]
MVSYSIDKYLDLPKNKAYTIILDEKNLRVLRVFLWFLIVAFIVILAIGVGEGRHIWYIYVPVMSLNILFLVLLKIFYKKIFNIENIRKYLFIFLLIQFVFIQSGNFINYFYPPPKQEMVPAPERARSDVKKEGITVKTSSDNTDYFSGSIIILCFYIVFFRFTRNEYLILYSIAALGPLILDLIFYRSLDVDELVPGVSITAMFLVISILVERKRYRDFSNEFDYQHKKNFETIRMRKELASAREIQLSMLPRNNHKTNEFEIAGISIPATEVGGDYFDYFEISDTKIGLFICDVSGHGVASGLLLSGLRSCMHMILEDTSEPRVVMEKLNRMMRKTQNRKMFVTAVFAVIDIANNKCEIFNAGHLPPYKISGTTNEIFKIKKHSITLGAMDSIFENGADKEVKFDFNKNDKLILYTDGVNEAMNTQKNEYGFDNIEKILYANTDKSANQLLNILTKDVERFTDGSIQRDDLTILIIGRN